MIFDTIIELLRAKKFDEIHKLIDEFAIEDLVNEIKSKEKNEFKNLLKGLVTKYQSNLNEHKK
jgi:hypothetical protein